MVNMSILQLVLGGLFIFDLGWSVGAAVQELIDRKKQVKMVQNMKNNLNILDCANNCNECHKKFDFPHNYCCLIECGEHEFCRNCNIKEKYVCKMWKCVRENRNYTQILHKIR